MSFLRIAYPTLAASIMAAGFNTTIFAQEQQLNEVVVTATGYEQELKAAPASISVINREELEKQSYTDITDALQNIPGLYVTNGGNMQDISLRGMSAAYTLILVDGRPVSPGRSVNTNGADGGKHIALPPLAMIERIEVIRGPMSSLYGSDAMGGVINIITRKVSKEWGGSVGTEYTKSFNDVSNDGFGINGYASGPVIPGLLGLKLNGNYVGFKESEFAGGQDGAASRPKTKRRNGGFEFVLTPDSANTFEFGYGKSRQDTRSTPGLSIASGAPSVYRFEKDDYMISHEGRYGDLMTKTYYQRDVSDKVQEQTKKEVVNILNTQATYALGNHLITFGAQYKTEKLTNATNGLLTALPDKAVLTANRWIGAVFAEADWAITDKFNLTTGLRANQDQFFGSHFTPRLYGVYTASPEWVIKGGVSTGYKQPTLAQSTEGIGSTTGGSISGTTLPHSRAISIGNPDLQPEKSTSYELSANFTSLDSKLSAGLTLFSTDFKNKIAEDTLCSSPGGLNNDYSTWSCQFGSNTYLNVLTTKNIDKAQMRGVEGNLDYKFASNLKISSSYTFTQSKQKSGANIGLPLNKQPRHMFNAVMDWDATSKLNIWLQGNYRSKTSDFLNRRAMAQGTPGYALFDLGFVYQLDKKTRLKAGLYNVANKEITNSTYGVVLDGRRVTVGLNYDF